MSLGQRSQTEIFLPTKSREAIGYTCVQVTTASSIPVAKYLLKQKYAHSYVTGKLSHFPENIFMENINQLSSKLYEIRK